MKLSQVLLALFRKRQEACGTQAALADRLHMSRATLNQILSGRYGKNINIKHLESLISAEKTEVSDFCLELYKIAYEMQSGNKVPFSELVQPQGAAGLTFISSKIAREGDRPPIERRKKARKVKPQVMRPKKKPEP